MSYATRTRDQHLANDGSPKLILALDGGLSGILSLGTLAGQRDIDPAHFPASFDLK
jgi:hypothetical protein